MATTTTKLGLTKPAPTDFYNVAVGNENLDKIDTAVGNLDTTVTTLESDINNIETSVANINTKLETVQSNKVLTAESTDGVAYTVIDSDITELAAGIKIVIKPNKTSTDANVTLNVNSFGAKRIRQRLSYDTSAVVLAPTSSWLAANKPIEIMYDGECWVTSFARTDANSMFGTLTASKVGAGTLNGKVLADATAEGTLGNAQIRNISAQTTDLTAGTTTLKTGEVVLVYE